MAAIRSGMLAILPTDTVYGLCADAHAERAVRELSRVKGRPGEMPIALLGATLDAVMDVVPEIGERSAAVARALLPGPYTLVAPNPARRFQWLTGARPETVGVRVPDLPKEARDVVERVGVVAATSANAHGGSDPRKVAEIPEDVRRAAAAIIDAGELPGLPSTVIDLTGRDAVVLREGAVPAADALTKIAAALRR